MSTKLAPEVKTATHNTGYSLVPMDVLRDRSLSDAAKVLYAVLDGRVTGKGSQRILEATLAEDTGWSVAKVRRVLAQLVAAGYVRTKRTGRSNGYRVANVARDNVRSLSSARSDRSDLSGLQINSSRSLTTTAPTTEQPQPTVPASTASPVAAGVIDDYRKAVSSAAGLRLGLNSKVRQALEQIAAQGVSADELGVLTSAYLAAHEGTIHSTGSFIAGYVLPAIAEGNRPEHKSELGTQTPTPQPPSVREILEAEPCAHGDLRGPSGCALCRRAAAYALEAA